jgi:predicted TPR repeat methyltransferase
LLAFSVEAHGPEDDDVPWRLQSIGRYSHQRGYVQQVLHGAGFVEVGAAAAVLRTEALKPVHGWVVQARVSPPGARDAG